MSYYAWQCNSCGSNEFTDSVSEDDVNQMNCSNCGASEFHRVLVALTLDPLTKELVEALLECREDYLDGKTLDMINAALKKAGVE